MIIRALTSVRAVVQNIVAFEHTDCHAAQTGGRYTLDLMIEALRRILYWLTAVIMTLFCG